MNWNVKYVRVSLFLVAGTILLWAWWHMTHMAGGWRIKDAAAAPGAQFSFYGGLLTLAAGCIELAFTIVRGYITQLELKKVQEELRQVRSRAGGMH